MTCPSKDGLNQIAHCWSTRLVIFYCKLYKKKQKKCRKTEKLKNSSNRIDSCWTEKSEATDYQNLIRFRWNIINIEKLSGQVSNIFNLIGFFNVEFDFFGIYFKSVNSIIKNGVIICSVITHVNKTKKSRKQNKLKFLKQNYEQNIFGVTYTICQSSYTYQSLYCRSYFYPPWFCEVVLWYDCKV